MIQSSALQMSTLAKAVSYDHATAHSSLYNFDGTVLPRHGPARRVLEERLVCNPTCRGVARSMRPLQL